jgi:penicillin amidase
MHSSGQSGLPWSAHYRSFLPRWAGVDYVPLWPEGPNATAGGTLVLKPGAR